MALIRFDGVTKAYGDTEVIRGIDLSIERGDFVTLVGPSGCGKTTLLKMINGLVPHDEGRLTIEDRDVRDWPPYELRRKIGYVIQQIGLFPHMTLEENILYVPTIKGERGEDDRQRAAELLRLVGLDPDLMDRYPRQLSGGQRQRVGVARALAADPEIILMDEPFGAVDEITRRHLQDELKDLHAALKKTIVFVTHDIEEAIKLGTTIVLLSDGKVVQAGDRETIIFHPNSAFSRDFFGIKNFSAYLTVTRVGEICDPDSPEREDYMQLASDAPILEALRTLMLEQVSGFNITDGEGHHIGGLDRDLLDHLKER